MDSSEQSIAALLVIVPLVLGGLTLAWYAAVLLLRRLRAPQRQRQQHEEDNDMKLNVSGALAAVGSVYRRATDTYNELWAWEEEQRRLEALQEEQAARPVRPTRRLQAVPMPQQLPVALPQQAPQLAGLRVLGLADVVNTLNRDIDEHPHVVIFGDSGSGKTTLAQVIAGVRQGDTVILDAKRPKGWEGPKWGGLPYVARGRDGSYTPMVEALTKVVAEMDSRYERQEYAAEPFRPLTVILDEAKVSVDECEALAELYLKVVSKGREARVRLILISTTDRARKLGFDGEADSLESFAHIRLGLFGRKVLPDAVQQGKEKYLWAAARLGGEWRAFDTSRTLEVAGKLAGRDDIATVWSAVKYNCQAGKPDDADSLLEDLLSNVSRPEVTSEALRFGTSLGSTFGPTIGTSDALSGKFRSAAKLLKEATEEEREVLRRTAYFFTAEGLSKTAAIKETWGVTGGDKFIRASELFEAWKLLKDNSVS